METLLQNYCFETIATCKAPEQQNQYVYQMGRDLGQLMAIKLAEIVTELMQSVLQRPAKGLVDESNAPLLTQKFWVQAIYTELLHASSRFRARREKEQKRPPHGLVKILCLPYEGRAQQRHGRRHASVLCFETLFGASCWVDSMFVWFPAAWMRLVVEAIRAKNVWWEGAGGHQGAVARSLILGNLGSSIRSGRWMRKERARSWMPRINVDWFTLDTRTFSHFFRQLYSGILHDVFTQKASMGWRPASTCRVVVSLLLPGSLEVEYWLLLARQKRNMWPMQMTTHTVGSNLPTEQFLRRERRRLKAKHIWVALDPRWIKLKEHLFTRHATNLGWGGLYERLFLNKYGSKATFL